MCFDYGCASFGGGVNGAVGLGNRLRPDVLDINHHEGRLANQIRGLICPDIDLNLAENRNRHHSDQQHKT